MHTTARPTAAQRCLAAVAVTITLLGVASCSGSSSKTVAPFETVGTVDGQSLAASVHAFTASTPSRWNYAFTFVSDRCAELWHHDVAEFRTAIEPSVKAGVIDDLNVTTATDGPGERTVVTFHWGGATVTERWIKQDDGRWRYDDCPSATTSTSLP